MKTELEPTLWRTCRVLTHLRRLEMLHILANGEGMCVGDMAARCRLPLPDVARHLRLLQSRGLIRATRHSRWVFYSAKADPLVRHGTALLAAVLSAVGSAKGRKEVRRALTAYTHPRRIAIVAALSSGPRRLEQLTTDCRISPPALHRHLRKLRRRGLVSGCHGSRTLTAPGSRVARRLLRIVLADRSRAPRR